MTPEEEDRLRNTIVRVCANGHAAITYSIKRGEAEPTCPVCKLHHQQLSQAAQPKSE